MLEELDVIFHKLVEFDIERSLKLLYDLQNEYYQIYNRKVHLDIMKQEMIRFLSTSADNVLTCAKQLDELYADISSFHKYLENISLVRTEYTNALEKQLGAITFCKYQCYENASQLREAIEYFNVPTECPPHL